VRRCEKLDFLEKGGGICYELVGMKFEPPDSHYLNAAQGWLGLGDHVEASAELDLIGPALQNRPEVLEARWQVHAKKRKWEECLEVGNALVASAPKQAQSWIHRSFALHELKRTREAFDALQPALEIFPKEWLIQYNLACYCCRLREHDRALRFLEHACKLGDARQIREMALQDADLQELWERVA